MISKNVLFVGGSSQIAIELARKIKNIDFFNLSRKRAKFYKRNIILKNYNFLEIKKKVQNFNKKFDAVFVFNGIYEQSTLSFFDEKIFKKIININLIVPIKISSLILEAQILKNGSSVNFITSLAGTKPAIGNAYYAISKNSLIFASKIFAEEFKKRKIRFNSVSLGLIKSKMSSFLISKLPKTKNKFKSNLVSINKVKKLILKIINNKSYNNRNFVIDK